ncbi:DUF2911 domain-containing protein [Mucilaginibacter sp. SG564]|uniref:DUF2911 domain-containing protein n=1 Tax=unclassified Mucilaginibacter TaxID=2617802 RepID=UPI0015548E69|nr:DUF2911 domain-containing protein [Mucilaginibacter sp. SG564]NOW98326.1 hypothetical protein [Mucilaginibacter sp. SG564]
MRKTYLFLATMLLACASYKSFGQAVPRIPEASSTQTIIQDFGLGKVTITYSRPNVKDRKIFGGIIPYGEVWRTGANAATTITFTEKVIIEGHNVPAGTYSLFSIPQRNGWTIILNKTVKQWGAYSYKQADDFLRFEIKSIRVNEKRETFTMAFANSNTRSTDLYLVWDHTAAFIHMETDDDAKIMANIDELMKGDRKPYYFNAIQWYYENNKDTDKALGWVAEAEKEDPKGPWFKLWESRLLLKKGDKAGAVAAAEAGIELSKESNDDEYLRLNLEALSQARN